MYQIRTIKKSVKYRNIGGKSISIERTLTKQDIIKQTTNGNWACYNFIDRRSDFPVLTSNTIFYYGHCEDGLGYIVCEDELEGK